MKSGYISDKQNRSQLIESELSSVKKIAYHYYGRIKNAVEIEDLLQIGFLGLVDASHRYVEAEQGSFKAYASIRIKGAIVDHLQIIKPLLNYDRAPEKFWRLKKYFGR